MHCCDKPQWRNVAAFVTLIAKFSFPLHQGDIIDRARGNRSIRDRCFSSISTGWKLLPYRILYSKEIFPYISLKTPHVENAYKIKPVGHNDVYILCQVPFFLCGHFWVNCVLRLDSILNQLQSASILTIHPPRINFPPTNITNKEAGFSPTRSWHPMFYTVGKRKKPWLRFSQLTALKWALSLFLLCLCRCVFLSFLSFCSEVVALLRAYGSH